MNQKKLWHYLIGIAILVLIIKYSDTMIDGGQMLLSIVMPMLIGCAMAYVLNILVVKLERLPFLSNPASPVYKARRGISILGTLVMITAVIALIVRIILPQLGEAFGVVLLGIPPMLEDLANWIITLDLPIPKIQEWVGALDVNWPQLLQKAVTYFSSGMSNLFGTTVSVVGSVGSIVVQLVVALIFALYLLAGKEKLGCQFRALTQTYLKENTCNRLMYVLGTAHDSFTKFIVGQVTEAVIIGVLCTLGMLLLRFPYATMIGTLIGATALIPIVGAYLGAAIGAFMILTVNPIQAVGFLVFIVVLQQLEGNLIYPRVVGSSIGLPGIWVLVAVTVGGGIGGIVGMLLAVPIAATVYKLLGQDVCQRRAAKANPETGAEGETLCEL